MILDDVIGDGSCPHLAMLLQRQEDVGPTLASFYALGAKRNGWLFHRTLVGQADADRAELTAAGLDVAGLEAAGRMAITEVDLEIDVHDWVHAWEPAFEAALAAGFSAAWWARFPIGPDEDIIERSVAYDAAWDEHFHDRPCVSLCLFIVGELETPGVVPRLAATHDAVLVGDALTPRAPGP
jgi:MEDS: MEthanogen/methylotroph, DcmR Sensory domain